MSSVNPDATMQRLIFVFVKRKCDHAVVDLYLGLTQMRRCRGRSMYSLKVNATMKSLVFKCDDVEVGFVFA